MDSENSKGKGKAKAKEKKKGGKKAGSSSGSSSEESGETSSGGEKTSLQWFYVIINFIKSYFCNIPSPHTYTSAK